MVFASDPIFAQIKSGIDTDKSVAKQVNGVYLFDLTADDGSNKKWTVDLKGNPGVYEGEKGKADCTVSMKDSDFMSLASGKLNGQQAFMQGKLKIKGNMGLAMKLGTVMKSSQGAKAASGRIVAKL